MNRLRRSHMLVLTANPGPLQSACLGAPRAPRAPAEVSLPGDGLTTIDLLLSLDAGGSMSIIDASVPYLGGLLQPRQAQLDWTV